MFRYRSKVMEVTDRDVVERLVHPDVFRKLRLSGVCMDGSGLKYTTEAGETKIASPIVTLANGIERREFFFATGGRLTIERDGLELLCEAYLKVATPAGERERKVLRCALRDRQLDGSKEASPLSVFPNTHEATNKLPHPDFKCAELSIYCYDPDNYLPESEMLDFIMKLDDYLYGKFDPAVFFPLWTRAFEASNMAPWQPAPPIRGVAQHFVEAAGAVLAEVGYHRMDAVCGWYNVVLFFIDRMKFDFTYGEHRAAFQALRAALHDLEASCGRTFNAREQAWLVALQSIPAKFIPDRLNLGVRWINTPTYTDYCCRIHRDLVPFERDPRMASVVLPAIFSAAPAEQRRAATPTCGDPPAAPPQAATPALPDATR